MAQYLRQLFPGAPDDAGTDLGVPAAEAQPLLHCQQDFADAEQADDGDQKVKSGEKFGNAERQAQLARDLIEPDGAERKADHHRRHGLGWRLLAHADEAAEREEIDGEFLGRPELQREPGDQRRNERDHDDRKQRADER